MNILGHTVSARSVAVAHSCGEEAYRMIAGRIEVLENSGPQMYFRSNSNGRNRGAGVVVYVRRAVTATVTAATVLAMNAFGQTAPFAATQPITFFTATSAKLNGMAVPNGLASTAWFEWGPRGTYDSQTIPTDVGAGSVVVPVSASSGGLINGEVYQSRLVVSNAAGVTFGAIQLFTTGRKVVEWGSNAEYQATFQRIPALGLSNAVSVAAGETFTAVLTADRGTVIVWNSDGFVQTQMTNAVSVSAGRSHILALLVDGTVAAWGDNRYGQTNIPTGL